MRSEQEKQEAIARLLLNKEKCNQFNYFDDDCHLAIDGSIKVIEEDLDIDDIDDLVIDDNTRDSMYSALDWLNGEIILDDLLFPEKED
jgi:hypothetical protein